MALDVRIQARCNCVFVLQRAAVREQAASDFLVYELFQRLCDQIERQTPSFSQACALRGESRDLVFDECSGG